jgi:PBSX family phage terminase large subunit
MTKLSSKYKQLWKAKTRYILLTGGRNSGKSFGASLYLAEQSYTKHFKALFTRYTMTSAKDSIIPEFTSKLELLNIGHEFHVTKEDVINTISGGQVMFRGIKTSSGDQTANLKSLEGVSHFIVDEGEEFKDKQKFDDIDLSVRNPLIENKVITIMNPSNTSHWVWNTWFANSHDLIDVDGFKVPISTHTEVTHIHTTYLDNLANIPKDYLEKLIKMRENQPEYYHHKILGAWLNHAEGALLKRINNFRLADIAEHEGTFSYIDVADEGADYCVMVVGKIKDNKIFIVDVVCDKSNTDITLPKCVAMAKKHNVNVCWIESNNMGAMFGRQFRIETPFCDTLLIANTTNKHTRIIIQAAFIQSYMHFLPINEQSAEYSVFMNLCLQYDQSEKENKSRNLADDPMDALSGLAMGLQSRLNYS